MAKLDDVLNSSLKQIKDKLLEKGREVIADAKESYQKTQPNLSDKLDRIEVVKETIEKLKLERDKLALEIKNADPEITTTEYTAAKAQYGSAMGGHRYQSHQSDIEIAKLIYKKKETKNLDAFDIIEKQIYNQFNLAVTNKQKQQVIFNLQSTIDWKSLGINLPNMFEAAKVEIKNGTIIIDNALPDNS